MAGYDESGFRIENGVLFCPYDMNGVPPNVLRTWCDELIAGEQASLSIDMSDTHHIASHHLGIVAQAWADAVGKGKQLIVKISPDLKRVFEMSGLDQIFDLAE